MHVGPCLLTAQQKQRDTEAPAHAGLLSALATQLSAIAALLLGRPIPLMLEVELPRGALEKGLSTLSSRIVCDHSVNESEC